MPPTQSSALHGDRREPLAQATTPPSATPTAEQAFETFSYAISHDLRAPIRTFKGYTEILIEDYGGEFPERAREYLDRMKRAAVGMDMLTRDLLQFSRISRQQISQEAVNVAAVKPATPLPITTTSVSLITTSLAVRDPV